MIEFEFIAEDHLGGHKHTLQAPALPRVGDFVEVKSRTWEVTKVTMHFDSPTGEFEGITVKGSLSN